jgi:hypothetical protein
MQEYDTLKNGYKDFMRVIQCCKIKREAIINQQMGYKFV